jgi:hypothetical protein
MLKRIADLSVKALWVITAFAFYVLAILGAFFVFWRILGGTVTLS